MKIVFWAGGISAALMVVTILSTIGCLIYDSYASWRFGTGIREVYDHKDDIEHLSGLLGYLVLFFFVLACALVIGGMIVFGAVLGMI